MTTANTIDATNPASPEERGRRRERNSKLYLGMESEVYDLSRMAGATLLLLEVYTEERNECAASGQFTGAQLMEHLEPWSDAVDFMMHHLGDMAHQMKRHYE
ncbi:MAG: hypothetical protein HXX15_21115 [Rhodopseudomonas sp.]|uniref:hypothetical protein n=1 Tax=Rhodopseudomonas sp. TaxID=1078 RepID=UPI0017E67E93|nr:hypothetical protein [Rhodopseudomonas sp.]NVN88587.1 hypothetical protein [Rhodopseudomonas sp.]